MKKSSKSRKNNFRINHNFFIFQSILIAVLMYITWGSWIKFIFFVAMEIAAYFALMFFLARRVSKKHNSDRRSKRTDKRIRNSNFVADESVGKSVTKRRNSKNYNWEITNSDSEKKRNISSDNNLNEKVERANIDNSPKVSRKRVEREDKSKFVPYRSPFDPILPKEKQNVQVEETIESKKNDAESTEETKEENLDVNLNEKAEDAIHYHLDENSKRDIPNIKMEDKEQTRIIESKGENKDNFNDDSETDLNIDFLKEEIQEQEEPLYDTTYNEKKFYKQEDNKVGLKENTMISSISKEKKETTNKPVQSGKLLLDIEEYEPPIELLSKNEQLCYDKEMEDFIEYNSYKLIDTLASFGVGAKIINVSNGPTVTRYELQPNPGVKVSKIINLADDIALNLAATGVRIEAPIPGKAAVGIEIPNKNNVSVFLRDVVDSKVFKNYPSKLAFAVGKDIAGNVVVGDIAKMPHLLIAGATGSGKSVCINTLIVSILYKASPAEVRLLMVDPKVVELGIYNGIPHLLIPVVTDPKKASGALSWAVIEMTTRYKLFADNNVRDLSSYNEMMKERGEGETLPHIVIIIDELADLMMVAPNEVEDSICRLAQMARAAGMHLVIATQRPSVNVITGVIKANIPSRISFAVSSQIDSRTILDMAGAEKLLGRGDMLFSPLGQQKPLRVQGSFISDKEVDKIVSHIKSLQSAKYDEEILQKIDKQNETSKPDTGGDDELLSQAIDMVLEMGQASASLIQRKFKVGYSRAARILDQMESWGVVGASEGSKPRQILINRQEWDELNS